MSTLDIIQAKVAEWLQKAGLSGSSAVLGVVLFVVSFFGSIALTGAVLVRLPPTFLVDENSTRAGRLSAADLALRVGRTVIGIFLILLGLVLSVPGVPGQGILTIIAGLFISELPGTQRLLRRILRSPKVRSAVNKLRARYKHPPLVEPPVPDIAAET
ncbi:MAG: hypothetical protein IPK82_16380 [Polyangiaceae bacterium]|nr:hypothetical protein [Polyangiaceae bacterium]